MTPRTTLFLLVAAPALALGAAAIAQAVTPGDITGPAPLVEAHAERGDGHRGHRGRQMGGMRMMGELIERVDADGDASITQEEVDAYVAAQVASADADGDGGLTLDEFRVLAAAVTQEARERMEARGFQMLDADASGTITAEEIDERFGGVVARMDRDGDGMLTPEDGGRRARR